MEITLGMFQAVCAADQIMAEFTNIVSGMGQRKAAMDEHIYDLLRYLLRG